MPHLLWVLEWRIKTENAPREPPPLNPKKSDLCILKNPNPALHCIALTKCFSPFYIDNNIVNMINSIDSIECLNFIKSYQYLKQTNKQTYSPWKNSSIIWLHFFFINLEIKIRERLDIKNLGKGDSSRITSSDNFNDVSKVSDYKQ